MIGEPHLQGEIPCPGPRASGPRSSLARAKRRERKTPQAIRGRIISKPDWIGGSEESEIFEPYNG